MAKWGVPWPAPQGWKKQITEHGYPYDPNVASTPTTDSDRYTPEQLERMVDNSGPVMVDGEPFDCEGDLDIDPVKLLRKVISAVIAHDQGHILYDFPDVLAFLGSRIPEREEVAHLQNIDERMFKAKENWPNKKLGQ